MPQPNAVNNHSRRERMFRRCNPMSKFQAAATVLVDKRFAARLQNYRKSAGDCLAHGQMATANVYRQVLDGTVRHSHRLWKLREQIDQ